MDIVGNFFDDGGEDEEGDMEGEGEAEDAHFNSGPVETPIFVRQASTATDPLPGSATRILQPTAIVPPFGNSSAVVASPINSSTFEVSRRGSRSQLQKQQQQLNSMAEMFLMQQQQFMEDERRYWLEMQRCQEEECEEERHQRDEEHHEDNR